MAMRSLNDTMMKEFKMEQCSISEQLDAVSVNSHLDQYENIIVYHCDKFCPFQFFRLLVALD